MGQSHAGWEVAGWGGGRGSPVAHGPFPSLEEGDEEGGSPQSTRWFQLWVLCLPSTFLSPSPPSSVTLRTPQPLRPPQFTGHWASPLPPPPPSSAQAQPPLPASLPGPPPLLGDSQDHHCEWAAPEAFTASEVQGRDTTSTRGLRSEQDTDLEEQTCCLLTRGSEREEQDPALGPSTGGQWSMTGGPVDRGLAQGPRQTQLQRPTPKTHVPAHSSRDPSHPQTSGASHWLRPLPGICCPCTRGSHLRTFFRHHLLT